MLGFHLNTKKYKADVNVQKFSRFSLVAIELPPSYKLRWVIGFFLTKKGFAVVAY